MARTFRPGDRVIWAKRIDGEFCFPVQATVLAVTAKRVKIEADDPEEGKGTHHVLPTSLQHAQALPPAKQGAARSLRAAPGRRAKTRLREDADRERRITYEVVVDCYDERERAMGWHCYLDDCLHFSFSARCTVRRSISPLHVGDEVEVIGMAPQKECEADIFVMIRWEKDGLGVPLAQLEPIHAKRKTVQAIKDWHYWIEMGYQF